MRSFIFDLIAYCDTYAGSVLVGASVIFLFEYILPQSRYSLISRVRGAVFWAVYIVTTGVSVILFRRLWSTLGIAPLFHVDLRFLSSSEFGVLAGFGGIVGAWLVMQIYSFFYYWFHRLQHTNRFLWRFHAEHHALEEMSAFNSNHHITEELFRLPFITIPMSLLFSFQQGYVPWLWALLIGWHGVYEHSSTKLHLGWFRYIVADNRFHRIHHSREKRHFNKNFGASTALWDIVFRTAHFPKKDEWPDVGLHSIREAMTVREFVMRPFRPRAPKLVSTEQPATVFAPTVANDPVPAVTQVA